MSKKGIFFVFGREVAHPLHVARATVATAIWIRDLCHFVRAKIIGRGRSDRARGSAEREVAQDFDWDRGRIIDSDAQAALLGFGVAGLLRRHEIA